jgi:hypothetical protein
MYKRGPFSSKLLRYALILRHTSLQTYKLLLKEFQGLPSISLLRKIQSGGVDALKSVKFLREQDEISEDVILMLDEMILQKSTVYHGGNFVGADEDGNKYKGILVLMVTGLKKNTPFVIKTCPEVEISGEFVFEQIDEVIANLAKSGFKVRGLVSDNHSSNVKAFNLLRQKYQNVHGSLAIKHPENETPTYLFFDNVHLMKNIRNNLLNAKKFVFPGFDFEIKDTTKVNFPDGDISWGDLHRVHDKDQSHGAHLRKARKLSYQALHPGNKKQNVKLALAIFGELQNHTHLAVDHL